MLNVKKAADPAAAPLFELESLPVYRQNPGRWAKLWSFALDMKKINGLKADTFTFADVINSDGVSASILFKREPTDQQVAAAQKAVSGQVSAAVGRCDPGSMRTPLETIWELRHQLNGLDYVGIDPGARDLVTVNRRAHMSDGTSWQDLGKFHRAPTSFQRKASSNARPMKRRNGRVKAGEVSFSVSTKSWRHNSGATKHEEQRLKWLRADVVQGDEKSTLYDLVAGIPTAKTSSTSKFLEHVKYFFPLLPRLLTHNVDRRRVRRERFDAQSRRRAAMDHLCNRITGGRKNVVVAFGAARPSQGFGHAPAPLRLLRGRLAQQCHLIVLMSTTRARCALAAGIFLIRR